MLNAHMTSERGAPWWAIMTPFVGVPLMVGVVALAATKVPEPIDVGAPTEAVQPESVEFAAGLDDHCWRPSTES